jgi:transcriptional regulator with XRE-family HTH domain
MTLLQRVNAIRKKKALSWVTISKQMKISRPTLDRFRNGSTALSFITIAKIENWLEKKESE